MEEENDDDERHKVKVGKMGSRESSGSAMVGKMITTLDA